LVEIKEIPFEDSEDPTEDNETNNQETTPEGLEKRSKEISSSLFKQLGIIILILSLTILPLTIITFFVNFNQTDETLLITQIVGFILFGIGTTIGSLLIINARRMKKKEDYVLELVEVEETENE
jgi:uncharacterized membrane protein YbhN (UPF0104 family)